jgi:hypothetical protein
MKRFFDVRFCYVIVLMVLGSSADAGHTFSFVVGRHQVRIEAPRHCHSTSCRIGGTPGKAAVSRQTSPEPRS